MVNAPNMVNPYISDTISATISRAAGHYLYIKFECRSKVGWVLRTFRAWEPQTRLTLWKQLIHTTTTAVRCGAQRRYGRSRTYKASCKKSLGYLPWTTGNSYRSYNCTLYSVEEKVIYAYIYIWKMLEGLAIKHLCQEVNSSYQHGIFVMADFATCQLSLQEHREKSKLSDTQA